MRLINEITNEPRQRHLLVIEGYDKAEMTLEFKESQNGWFMSIVWGTFELLNRRVTFTENILRQFRYVLPFGIAVTTTSGQDPLTGDDFSNGTASLFLLTSTEVEDLQGEYIG